MPPVWSRAVETHREQKTGELIRCDDGRVGMLGGEELRLSITHIVYRQATGGCPAICLWLNGNRSVLVDHHLSGVVAGLTLATRAPDIYRALVESTAFGTG